MSGLGLGVCQGYGLGMRRGKENIALLLVQGRGGAVLGKEAVLFVDGLQRAS